MNLKAFVLVFMIWNFDEDIQSFSAWLACAVSLMTVTAAKFNQKPPLSLITGKWWPISAADLKQSAAESVGTRFESRVCGQHSDLTDEIKKQITSKHREIFHLFGLHCGPNLWFYLISLL